MRQPITFVAAALLLLLPACAGRTAAGGGAAPRDRRVIALAELSEAIAQNVSNLDQLVRTRRPEWLRATPQQTGVAGPMAPSNVTQVSQLVVWMDNQRLGGPEVLRTIPLTSVSEVRLLSASEAEARFGLNNQGGAIMVTGR
jgi:hypothetical protein